MYCAVERELRGKTNSPVFRSVPARAALSIWWALRTSVSCLPVNAALVSSGQNVKERGKYPTPRDTLNGGLLPEKLAFNESLS